jgi:hypothetical protein
MLLFYTLVTLQEFFFSDKVLNVFRFNSVRKLNTLNFWLHDWEMSYDNTEALESKNSDVIKFQ